MTKPSISNFFYNKFWILVLLIVVVDLSIFFDITLLRHLLAPIIFLSLPGYLIIKSFRLQLSRIKQLVYGVGLSIATLINVGLLVNKVGLLAGYARPLTLGSVLLGMNIVLATLLLVSRKELIKPILKIKSSNSSPTKYDLVMITAALITPLLAFLGTNVLNNGGSNILSVSCFIVCSVILISLVFLHRRLMKYSVFTAIYCASLSILLLFSLRSTVLVGWDIFQEFGVFQTTLINGFWSQSAVADAYNSCMSITVLPTMIKLLSGVADVTIFKFIFQICFAVTPIVLFLLFQKFASVKKSIVAVLFYVAQYQFFVYSGWARQEIAIMFFALMLLIMYEARIGVNVRKLFILVFGFGMITSHYSTTYLSISCLVIFYLAVVLTNLIRRKSKKIVSPISGRVLITLLLLAFMWGFQLTGSYGGLTGTLQKSFSNITSLLSDDVRMGQASPLQQFNLNYQSELTGQDLEKYVDSTQRDYKARYSVNNSPSTNTPIELAIQTSIEPKISGSVINIIGQLGELTKKLDKVFIIVGVIVLMYLTIKRRSNGYMFLMSSSALFILVALTALPFLSLDYNILRAYQHLLCVLALPAAIGVFRLTSFLRPRLQMVVIGGFLVYQLLFLSSTIYQFTGGASGNIQFNNYGASFNEAYSHTSEVLSATWLNNNYNRIDPLYADHNGSYRLKAFGHNFGRIREDVIPQVISTNAYVYSDYSNSVSKQGVLPSAKYLNGKPSYYVFPGQFLTSNKNVIYSNTTTKVYK